MKKIGDYLIENRICDESSLKNALQEQLKLKEKNVFRPLGSILTESDLINAKDLDMALSQMHFDIVSASALFKDISNDSLTETLSLAEYRVLPENSVIFNKGDQPDAFFIVISGKMKVFLPLDEGKENELAVLKAGDGFGEISLLTSEPHRTSARTITSTSLLVLQKTHLHRLCAQNTEISMALIKGFASRLVQKEDEIVKAGEKELAYQQFVSQQDDLSLPELDRPDKEYQPAAGKNPCSGSK